MADHVVQCGACRVAVHVVLREGVEVARCPACGRTAPKDEAIRTARSALIEVVMRDLDENLRAIVRASPSLDYRPAPLYDWVVESAPEPTRSGVSDRSSGFAPGP